MAKSKIITDFNGMFEAGSDNGDEIRAHDNADGVSSPVVATSGNKVYEGHGRIENGRFIFTTLGGGEFDVEMSFDAFADRRLRILGRQEGAVIKDAKISVMTEGGGTSTRTESVTLIDENLKAIVPVVEKFRNEFSVNGLLTVRPSYEYSAGEVTSTPAILCVLEVGITDEEKARIPSRYKDYPVETVIASPRDYVLYKEDITESKALLEYDAFKPTIIESLSGDSFTESTEMMETGELRTGYARPDHISLDAIEGPAKLLCHVSPEAGWANLSAFLESTKEHLQVAMYDFSAPHLSEKLKDILTAGCSLKMVYDAAKASGVGTGSKKFDKTEEFIIKQLQKAAEKDKLELMPAWKGVEGICYKSYHIKVAVQDKKRFWLSSGNWQTSNQPNETFADAPNDTVNYNREWNIIVQSPKIAKVFHDFIDYDYKVSGIKPETEEFEFLQFPEFFWEAGRRPGRELTLFKEKEFNFKASNPVNIQPILTPDNYIEHVLKLIRDARKSLLFQNQYITIAANSTDAYKEMLKALQKVTKNRNIDCRIILRKPFSLADKRTMMDNLQAFKFDTKKVKFMDNTHTKGIIVDGETILLGSHNWSAPGVEFNRDASLIIYNKEVAEYYQEIFEHDWEKRTINSREEASEETAVIPKVLMGTFVTPSSKLTPFDWGEYID